MGVRLYREDDRARWDNYAQEQPEASCYHLAGWKDVIEQSFGHTTFYLLAEGNAREIAGILPLVQLKSMLFGNFMVSLPFFNYGGVCSDSREVESQLMDEAASIARREKAEHIEFRHSRPVDGALSTKTTKVSMRLELPADADELWGTFTSNLRRKIRKAEKEGFSCRIGKRDQLDDFYTVFSINMRDLGTPVYPKAFFANILKELPEDTWIATVYTKGGKPAASLFLVGFKKQLEMPWASSIKDYNRHYPNLLLYWSALKFACREGYFFFDFGRSTRGSGTYRFKEQWGAKPHQLYWHYWMRRGELLPEINPQNPKYQLAIRLWRRLPLGLTRVLGPRIVKNLP
jgi:FemAB-related protein (PEP-CTERM system-associated)